MIICWFPANEESCSTQLIDGDGNFNVTGIEHFIKKVRLGDCGLSYAVVSIMGPQSSGMTLFWTNNLCLFAVWVVKIFDIFNFTISLSTK